jgi:hypothetical protein
MYSALVAAIPYSTANVTVCWGPLAQGSLTHAASVHEPEALLVCTRNWYIPKMLLSPQYDVEQEPLVQASWHVSASASALVLLPTTKPQFTTVFFGKAVTHGPPLSTLQHAGASSSGTVFTPVTDVPPLAVPPRPSLTSTEHVNVLRLETAQVAEELPPDAHPNHE